MELRLAPKVGRALSWVAAIYIIGSNLLYAVYGFASFPAQEWILEATFAVLFLMPVLSWIKSKEIDSRVLLGLILALVGHSIWDLLHWPALGQINTAVDPHLPMLCPWGDLALAGVMLVMGLAARQAKGAEEI